MFIEYTHEGINIGESRKREGYLAQRLYIGYTREEALKLFRDEFPKEA
jgi:hypothetical protein